jgi:hypothetical protein
MTLNPNEADVVRDYGWLLGYLSDTQADGRHGPMDAFAPCPIRLDAQQAGNLIWRSSATINRETKNHGIRPPLVTASSFTGSAFLTGLFQRRRRLP